MTKHSQHQDMLFVGVEVCKATLEVAFNDKQGSEPFPNDEAALRPCWRGVRMWSKRAWPRFSPFPIAFHVDPHA